MNKTCACFSFAPLLHSLDSGNSLASQDKATFAFPLGFLAEEAERRWGMEAFDRRVQQNYASVR